MERCSLHLPPRLHHLLSIRALIRYRRGYLPLSQSRMLFVSPRGLPAHLPARETLARGLRAPLPVPPRQLRVLTTQLIIQPRVLPLGGLDHLRHLRGCRLRSAMVNYASIKVERRRRHVLFVVVQVVGELDEELGRGEEVSVWDIVDVAEDRHVFFGRGGGRRVMVRSRTDVMIRSSTSRLFVLHVPRPRPDQADGRLCTPPRAFLHRGGDLRAR